MTDVCVKCGSGEGTDWIQCHSWLHRKRAGLSNYMIWKNIQKTQQFGTVRNDIVIVLVRISETMMMIQMVISVQKRI